MHSVETHIEKLCPLQWEQVGKTEIINWCSDSYQKLDRGYDDYVSGRVSEEFWTRKSEDVSEHVRVDAAIAPAPFQPSFRFRRRRAFQSIDTR